VNICHVDSFLAVHFLSDPSEAGASLLKRAQRAARCRHCACVGEDNIQHLGALDPWCAALKLHRIFGLH
jgi:hypothetical protein